MCQEQDLSHYLSYEFDGRQYKIIVTLEVSPKVFSLIKTHTHTHTHIYIYIERERERERRSGEILVIFRKVLFHPS